MSAGERRLRGLLRLLSLLDERRYPQVVTVGLGTLGASLGLLLLLLPSRFAVLDSFAYLFAGFPPVGWGCLLLALGASLATAAGVAYDRSHYLSAALGFVLFVFALLSGLGVLNGAPGVVGLLTMGLAWLLILSAAAGIAPKVREVLA